MKESLTFFFGESKSFLSKGKPPFQNKRMEGWKARKQARQRLGLTQSEVASKFDPPITRVAVGLWERPVERGGTAPDSKRLQQLASLYNIDVGALLGQTPTEPNGFPESGIENEQSVARNVRYAPLARMAVPVISSVQAGKMKEIGYVPEVGDGDRWERPDHKLGKRGWAMVVEGDSMDDGSDKAVPEGWLIFVDPDVAPTAGKYVIAKDVATQAATFKKLVYDAGRWYLKPLNRQYQAIEIDNPELRVIGVVTEARPPSRKLV